MPKQMITAGPHGSNSADILKNVLSKENYTPDSDNIEPTVYYRAGCGSLCSYINSSNDEIMAG